MNIINNSESFRLYDLNHYDDYYFSDLNTYIHQYRSSIVIIDITNAMKPGKACTRWLFSISPWKMQEHCLCEFEYVEMAAVNCNTVSDLLALLRSGAPLTEVDGLTVEISAQPSTRTFSPFASIKPVKLGDRLNASTIAKAICAGQIISGRTDGRYTDDYAADAGYNFYRGDIDLYHFAADIYEHPSGWRFWWKNTDHSEIVAACHTFDYKTLVVA